MAVVHSFDVEIVSRMTDGESFEWVGSVSLGGVVIYSQDVTQIMYSSAPTRYEEAVALVLYEVGTRLARLLGESP